MGEAPVVVAYDGSTRATAAIDWALDEGERRKLPVCLVRVGPPPSDADASADEVAVMRRLASDADDWGRRGIAVTGELCDGPVACVLCERSAAASLLVLGDRGLGGFTGLRIGSVSMQVAAHARSPVVVFRDDAFRPSRRPVAVGVDDSPDGQLAVGLAFEEADARGVGLLAVRGVGTGSPDDEQHVLDTVMNAWRGRYPAVDVTARLVPSTAGHALMVASREAQLLVVGSRGAGGFDGLPLGSVTHQLLHHSLCALMIVRPS